MSTPDNDVSGAPMEPTAEAIDAWRAQGGENGWPSYGVDIKTKSGSWRCITERVEEHGHIWYWTIRGEGSSNRRERDPDSRGPNRPGAQAPAPLPRDGTEGRPLVMFLHAGSLRRVQAHHHPNIGDCYSRAATRLADTLGAGYQVAIDNDGWHGVDFPKFTRMLASIRLTLFGELPTIGQLIQHAGYPWPKPSIQLSPTHSGSRRR